MWLKTICKQWVALCSRRDRDALSRFRKKPSGYGRITALAKLGYHFLLLWVFTILAFWIIGTSSAIALSGEAPDLSRTTFGSLPAFEQAGHISGVGNVSQTLGYDPARSWEAGDHPADVIKLGDLEESLAPQEFTLAEIGLRSGIDMSNVALSAFPLIRNQTLSSLVKSVPYLGEFALGDSPPLYDAVITRLFSDNGSTAESLNRVANQRQSLAVRQVANRNMIAQVNGLDEAINQAEDGIPAEGSGTPDSASPPSTTGRDGGITNPATQRLSDLALDNLLGGIDLSDLNLDDYAITDIPNLENAIIKDQDGWQDAVVSQIPGLEDVEYSQYPNAVKAALSGIGGIHDVTYGPKESRFTRTKYSISGSFEDGFGVNCAQDRGCAYLELEGAFAMHGARWISGGNGEGQQMVNGGFGVLGNVNGGKEPTGRHPFGEKAFKVVLTKTDESEGKGDFGLYFRVCKRGIPDLGCTPFFLGPVPVYSTREKGFVLTGLLEGGGGSTSGLRAPDGWEDLRPATPKEVRDLIGANTPSRGGFGLCGEGPGGVNFQSLAAAFSSIEGDYNSVGSYVNGGRGLGRYQYMTYREDVRATIRQKEGGAAFLAKADSGAVISGAEVEQYFTPSDQDALFKDDQTRNIEQAVNEGFTGSRIIERIGQIHFGGPGAPIDGNSSDTHGRLTLKTYGEELAETYRLAEIQAESESQCETGGLIAGRSIEEAIAYEQADFQDFDAYRAYRSGYHAGIDFDSRFGAGEGGEVVSVVGGEVTDVYSIAANRVTGEASMSVVLTSTDSEGREITQIYTHLSESSVNSAVQVGTVVGAGQSLGAVGGEDSVSRGAHLDYKVKVDGVYVDPDEFMQAVIDGGGTLTTIDVSTGAQGTTQVGAIP